MCVIMTHGPGVSIDRDEWLDAWYTNSDGGGIAYVANGRLRVAHSMDRDELWAAYNAALDHRPDAVMVHMRIATHGRVDKTNCHPFLTKDGTAIAHNGILTKLAADTRKGESDTRALVRVILDRLPAHWAGNVATLELLEDYIDGDRLAVLYVGPKGIPVLHHLGPGWERDKTGVTYSNTYHQWHHYRNRPAAYTAPLPGQGKWLPSEDGGEWVPEGNDTADDDDMPDWTPPLRHARYCGTCLRAYCQCESICDWCGRYDDMCQCPKDQDETGTDQEGNTDVHPNL